MTALAPPALRVATLHDRALMRVSGPDWRAFLQGLLSQDVLTLGAGELRFAALLNPQGKLLFDLFVLGQDEGCLLDVAADRRADLARRLTLYRLRAKVEIAETPEAAQAAWNTDGPLGGEWLRDPRLPDLGYRGYGAAAPQGAAPSGPDDYARHRLALGVPDAGRDCPPETHYPIEANFDLLNGIDFKKGCFVGQETTSRMKRRGVVRTRMLPIRFEGPPPAYGAEVLAGELRAGETRCGGEDHSMALLRLDRIEAAPLTVEGRAVRAERPGYFGDWAVAET